MAFYDQAFKVELNNGLRFITNYRYSVKEYVSSDPLKDKALAQNTELDTDDYDKFNSQCDRTMIGFVQNKEGGGSFSKHHIECFYGIKESVDGGPPKPAAAPKP